MSTIDKEKFQFVKRDDFASETIDAPAYSYSGICLQTVFEEKINNHHAWYFDFHRIDEFHLPNVLRF